MFTNKLLVTGIGSLPYVDVEKALDKVAEYCPQLPFWPQLPKRSKQELMLEAFLFPWIKEGLVIFRHGRGIFSEKINKLDLYHNSLEKYNPLPENIAPGLYKFKEYFHKGLFTAALGVKGQVTGPNTLSKYNLLESGLPLNHNKQILKAVLKLVQEQINFQIDFLKELKLPLIIFIDEPAGFTNFYEPNGGILEQGLWDLIMAARKRGVVIGIHCCNKPDWYKLSRLPVDIISFDASNYQITGKDKNYIIDFLSTGGRIAWGIIPTSGAYWPEIHRRVVNYKDLIKMGGLITASCGLGLSTESTVEEIMEYSKKVVELITSHKNR
ncbi:MAG: hypothetical protein PWQ67_581 [Clostridia bacterium]|jgi:hypothetical protein|nr:hypothetical protein [Clostridia bacterium]MDN5322127.1 hypothetical protein [Clostridia bacterium]